MPPRPLLVLGALVFACQRGPVVDPGGVVSVVTRVAPGSLVLTGCQDPLAGDPAQGAPVYSVDPHSGVVRRWLPPGADDGVWTLRNSATTRAMFFSTERSVRKTSVPVLWELPPDGHVRERESQLGP